MLTLETSRLREMAVPIGTRWLLADCLEDKEKQESWISQKPALLETLHELAIVHSVESSNRIEGVTIPPARLRPVVLDGASPNNRPEEELAGYRKALDFIFSSSQPNAMTPELIIQLHGYSQGASASGAMQWKQQDSAIVETLPGGENEVRFLPTSAKDTPKEIEKLCGNYREILQDERISPLLAMATFVFDFLCIHPFQEGNGRVSRLITALLLESHGFKVARFISLERLVEESNEEYRRAFYACSNGWHEGRNEIAPWWNYFLYVVRRAYRELEEQLQKEESPLSENDLVRQSILSRTEPFTLAELSAQFPASSTQSIKKTLAELKANGKTRAIGKGRGTRWEIVQENE